MWWKIEIKAKCCLWFKKVPSFSTSHPHASVLPACDPDGSLQIQAWAQIPSSPGKLAITSGGKFIIELVYMKKKNIQCQEQTKLVRIYITSCTFRSMKTYGVAINTLEFYVDGNIFIFENKQIKVLQSAAWLFFPRNCMFYAFFQLQFILKFYKFYDNEKI